jgi:hypothetical protein
MGKLRGAWWLGLMVGWHSLTAGVVETNDGSVLYGTILELRPEHVVLQTAYAGRITIARKEIASIQSPHSFNVRTADGAVVSGPIRSDALGRLIVGSGRDGNRIPLRNVHTVWRKGEKDPVAPSGGGAIDIPGLRKWRGDLSVDVTGRDGNSDRLSTKFRGNAFLEGSHDRLHLYTSYDRTIDSGRKRSDELIGGVRFTSFTQGRLGWFVREELERDGFEGIEIRSTTAGGATWRFINEAALKLEGSGGVSYRYESYNSGGERDYPGLDFGMLLQWDISSYARLRSRVNYIPSVESFGDFLVDHDSGVEFPIDNRSIWKLRLGLNTKYNNRPGGTREKLDTEYYTRLILSFK